MRKEAKKSLEYTKNSQKPQENPWKDLQKKPPQNPKNIPEELLISPKTLEKP
jgi:hypothetical protein